MWVNSLYFALEEFQSCSPFPVKFPRSTGLTDKYSITNSLTKNQAENKRHTYIDDTYG